MNPMMRKKTLSIRLSIEIGSGIKLLSIIARPDALPTAALLGTIKKNIAAAATAAPNVIIEKSFKLRRKNDFFTELPLISIWITALIISYKLHFCK